MFHLARFANANSRETEQGNDVNRVLKSRFDEGINLMKQRDSCYLSFLLGAAQSLQTRLLDF